MFLEPLRRLTKNAGLHLILWYSAIFVLSSVLLFGLAYLMLSSSIQDKDRELIRSKIDEYASQYQTGGIKAVAEEMDLERTLNERAGLFVRLRNTTGQTLFFGSPVRWKE
jgi:hypothetical protein